MLYCLQEITETDVMLEGCEGAPYFRQRIASAPRTKAPPGSTDCHAHIFGPLDRFPFAKSRSYTPADASREEYLGMLATLGLERMIIVQPSVYGFDNGATIGAVCAFGLNRARAIVHVSRRTPIARLRELDGAGARGVRFITVFHGGARIDELTGVAKRIAPFGWHLQLYLPRAAYAELEPTIRRLPVPVVFDHMGGIMADTNENDPGRLAMLRLLETGKCWVKLSGYRSSIAGPPFPDVAPIAHSLIVHARERCVWGTDWPHPAMQRFAPDDGRLFDLLAEWAEDPETLHRILVDNPAALYGFR